MIVYLTENNINDKPYVGIDSIDRPWYYGSGYRINCAIEKYGKGNFVKHTLRKCNSIDELYYWEKYFIKLLKTRADVEGHYGYNLTDGGEGVSGRIWIDEEKAKRSKKYEGSGNPYYGKKHSLEARKKMTEAWIERRKKVISDETRKKMSSAAAGKNNPMYGKDCSEIVKKGWETRRKNGNDKPTPTERKNRSDAAKKVWAKRKRVRNDKTTS